MTRDRSVDERISAWLFAEAPNQLPDRVLQATFEQTRPTRQRRTLLRWRPYPMNRTLTRLAVGAAAIVVLALGVALLPRSNSSVGAGPSPTPSSSPTLMPISLSGQIAFERTVDGNTDIYLMNLDRSGLVRLTDDPARDGEPSWSADGQRIVFTRGVGDARDVYVMAADGSTEVRLTDSTEGEEAPAFSPDGSRVAFLRYVDPTFFDFYVVDADGSNERLVFHQAGPYACCPVWSPDGQALYFNMDTAATRSIAIARLDLASSDVTLVVDDAGDDSTFALSPDGSTIAFQSDRTPGGIFVTDANGENVRHVTGAWTKGYPMSWSPDAAHLVYAQDDGWLYLVGVDGTNVTRWAEGGSGVAWRPAP